MRVRVRLAGGRRIIILSSDDGAAFHETMSALANERVYTRVATDHCKRYGAQFDGCSMLFIRVSADQLRGAAIAMATLTKDVIDQTLERSFSAKVDENQEKFVRLASEAFADCKRTERASLTGQSSATYEFDLLVELETKALAFNYFSKSGGAVNSAFVALSDISRLENGPRVVGVTPRLEDIGPKLVLISSIATVIEASADVANYKKLAA